MTAESNAWPTGRRVQITELAETPLEGVEKFVTLADQDAPDVGTLAAEDVLIAVKSSSINWVDLLMLSGQYQHMPPLPYTPGLEFSGTALWVGSAVKDIAPGDAVFIDGLLTGPRSPGAYQQYGGFASYAVAPAHAVRAIPKGLDFDHACNLLGSYETAYHCLVACGDIQPGETVLIHGASGATGLAAVHVAKLMGATVIATGRSEEKLAVVKEQGADHIVNTGLPDGEKGVKRFREEVKDLTGGKGVDVVYDGVGGEISLESLRCVRFGARYLIVGWAATPFVAKGKGGRGAPNANVLPTNLIMMKGLKVLGCPTVIATQHDPSIRPKRLGQVLAWVEAGKLTPHVSHTFTLDNIQEALRAKWTGKIIGGCAVRP
jgi:NADPH2:quinone reductase